MKDSYTPTEVGVLIEALRSEFRFVGEKVGSLLPLIERMTAVEEKLTSLDIHVGALESAVRDVFRTELPALKTRLTRFETTS